MRTDTYGYKEIAILKGDFLLIRHVPYFGSIFRFRNIMLWLNKIW